MSRPAVDDWRACPPGELSRLSSRLRSRRTRRSVVRACAVVAVVACAALGVWRLRPTGQANQMMDLEYAGIRCGKVIELAKDYAMHKLDSGLSDQIKAHVEQCPRCHKRFKDMGLITRFLRRIEGLDHV
jgi:uncharacterized C2H2 Zn-finger protein